MKDADMTDAEVDFLLERFDQTEPNLQRLIVAHFVCENIKLKKFKDYVHSRFDAAGVPADPESPHKAKGCRIGGRLDIVLAGYIPQANDIPFATSFTPPTPPTPANRVENALVTILSSWDRWSADAYQQAQQDQDPGSYTDTMTGHLRPVLETIREVTK